MAVERLNLAGSRIRKLRVAGSLTQEQLAARCQTAGWDVTRGTLAKIEAGVRRLNDAEAVVLAKCLKVDIADLLDGFSMPQALSVVRHGVS
jgi:transcriptional regulator with XRE-family HTH domain